METRDRPRRALLVLVPAALFALSLFARSAAEQANAAFTGYETPFAFANPQGVAMTPLSERVVIVLVDGLGLAPSRELPFLNKLRAQGADYACRIGLPSLSLPGRAVQVTGAWQEVSGQSTNHSPRPIRVETIFQTARRRGLGTALAAGQSVQTLFEPWISDKMLYAETPETATFPVYEADLRDQAEKAQTLVKRTKAALVYVEYHIVDESGHGWGGSSEEYRKAALETDKEIEKLAQSVDFAKTTFIVTADHGHVAEGGHGGPEEAVMQVPLVLAGKGVRAGYTGTAAQIDLASTVSALLGIPIPASNQGEPLLDGLTLEPGPRLSVLRALMAQRESFVTGYVRWVSGGMAARLREGEDPARVSDEAWFKQRLQALARNADEAKTARMGVEEALRSRRAALIACVPLLLLLLLVLARAVAPREALVALFCAAVGVGAYHLALRFAGLGYSFTAVNKDEWLAGFFLKDMVLGVSCCTLAVALASGWMRRSEPCTRWDLAGMAWLTAAAFCSVFVVKIALIYWRYGIVMRWRMLDQYWGFSFYLDALAVMAVGFVALLLPLVAFAVAAVVRPAVVPPLEARSA